MPSRAAFYLEQNFFGPVARILIVLLEEMLPTCRDVAICHVLTVMLLVLYVLSIGRNLDILLLSCGLLLHITSHLSCCTCTDVILRLYWLILCI